MRLAIAPGDHTTSSQANNAASANSFFTKGPVPWPDLGPGTPILAASDTRPCSGSGGGAQLRQSPGESLSPREPRQDRPRVEQPRMPGEGARDAREPGTIGAAS